MADENVTLSPEEIAKRKQEMIDYYKDQIDFLSVQSEFERLATSIQESRTKRLMYKLQEIQLSMNIKETDEEESEESDDKSETAKPTTTRNLRREK